MFHPKTKKVVEPPPSSASVQEGAFGSESHAEIPKCLIIEICAWSFAYRVWCNSISCQEKKGGTWLTNQEIWGSLSIFHRKLYLKLIIKRREPASPRKHLYLLKESVILDKFPNAPRGIPNPIFRDSPHIGNVTRQSRNMKETLNSQGLDRELVTLGKDPPPQA